MRKAGIPKRTNRATLPKSCMKDDFLEVDGLMPIWCYNNLIYEQPIQQTYRMRNAINPKRGCRGGLDAEIGKNPDRGEHEGPVFNEFQIGLRRDEFLKFF
ncbi:MAG: hypothetical protein JW384_02472 [Nitrosomonadaceae bacterium]|nr:hypothetical protein [Nitrosomonadaceae bacterium]